MSADRPRLTDLVRDTLRRDAAITPVNAAALIALRTQLEYEVSSVSRALNALTAAGKAKRVKHGRTWHYMRLR